MEFIFTGLHRVSFVVVYDLEYSRLSTNPRPWS